LGIEEGFLFGREIRFEAIIMHEGLNKRRVQAVSIDCYYDQRQGAMAKILSRVPMARRASRVVRNGKLQTMAASAQGIPLFKLLWTLGIDVVIG